MLLGSTLRTTFFNGKVDVMEIHGIERDMFSQRPLLNLVLKSRPWPSRSSEAKFAGKSSRSCMKPL